MLFGCEYPLGESRLTGKIPGKLLTSPVRFLTLAGNELSGELPQISMADHAELYLYNNNLSGIIPKPKYRMWKLALQGNRFRGEIPEMDVKNFWAQDNELSGKIPFLLRARNLTSVPSPCAFYKHESFTQPLAAISQSYKRRT